MFLEHEKSVIRKLHFQIRCDILRTKEINCANLIFRLLACGQRERHCSSSDVLKCKLRMEQKREGGGGGGGGGGRGGGGEDEGVGLVRAWGELQFPRDIRAGVAGVCIQFN